jgi:hypothetical protein
VRLAFGDALDFRRVHAVHLALVVPLLSVDALGNLRQLLELQMRLFILPPPNRHFTLDVADDSTKIGLEPLLFALGTLHLPRRATFDRRS